MKKIRVHFADFTTMDGIKRRILEILAQKYEVILDSDNPQYLFYSVFGAEHIKYDCVRIFYTGENIAPDFNFCDYAIAFCHLNFGERYLRYPLYLFYGGDYLRARDKHLGISNEILRQKRRFCNFIVSNGGANPLRREFYEILSAYKRVDSAGRFLNNVGGAVADKFAFQSECKFSLCFENSSTSGYTTEKLIQAVAARTIPIYWGDKSAFGALDTGGGGNQ
ncbi:glycosyltransferase family 10 domain-containing protein [Helicobacter sp. 23-1045]